MLKKARTTRYSKKNKHSKLSILNTNSLNEENIEETIKKKKSLHCLGRKALNTNDSYSNEDAKRRSFSKKSTLFSNLRMSYYQRRLPILLLDDENSVNDYNKKKCLDGNKYQSHSTGKF